MTTDVSFTTTSSFTIPSGFNTSDIVGFAFNSIGNGANIGNASVFFKNGSYVVSQKTETGPFTFSSVLAYSLPANFDANDAIGADYHRSAGDIAMFFRNGSYVSNTAQTDITTNIVFNTARKATYHSDAKKTESTNIT